MKYNCKFCDFHWEGTVDTFDKVRIHEKIHEESKKKIMIQPKSERQKNKNNKTKPANLLKKEYLESYEELKKSIKENQKT